MDIDALMRFVRVAGQMTYEVYECLGDGLFEKVYANALAHLHDLHG